MRLRYLVTLKGTGKVNRKVSPRVIYIYIYIYTYMAGFNKICVRATDRAGSLVLNTRANRKYYSY